MDAAHCEDDRERGQRHCRACGGHRELRSEEHTSELQSRLHLVCRLLLEKKKHHISTIYFSPYFAIAFDCTPPHTEIRRFLDTICVGDLRPPLSLRHIAVYSAPAPERFVR